jgi:LysM repeat protein
MRTITRPQVARPQVVRAWAGAIAALLVVCAVGCTFDGSDRKKVEAATAADIGAMRSDIARLRQDVEALDAELDRSDKALRNEIAGVRRAIEDLDKTSAGRITAVKNELAKQINDIERKRISDKNALNAKMDAIVAEVQKALGGASGTGTTSTRTVRGFEYTVQEGDNVSKIAAKFRDKYGTTTKAILEANNLTVNSIIRPGDTLLIPVKE